LVAATIKSALKRGDYQKSLIDVSGTGLEVPSVRFQGEDLIVRIFNAEGDATSKNILYRGKADIIQMVELNGHVVKTFHMQKDKFGDNVIEISLPRFGVRTIRFCNAHI
jgi:alpha-mannosidase